MRFPFQHRRQGQRHDPDRSALRLRTARFMHRSARGRRVDDDEPGGHAALQPVPANESSTLRYIAQQSCQNAITQHSGLDRCEWCHDLCRCPSSLLMFVRYSGLSFFGVKATRPMISSSGDPCSCKSAGGIQINKLPEQNGSDSLTTPCLVGAWPPRGSRHPGASPLRSASGAWPEKRASPSTARRRCSRSYLR